MKIQFLNGGLANQAFQYIFARYYELACPGESMYMDDTYFALHTVHNGYELEKVFGIKPHMLSQCFDEEVWNFILEERRKGKSVPTILCENGISTYAVFEGHKAVRNFNPFDGETRYVPGNDYIPWVLKMEGNVYYDGYWINKGWFNEYKEIFLKEFTFPEISDEINRERLNRIQGSRSVSVHIRRGDYVGLGGRLHRKSTQSWSTVSWKAAGQTGSCLCFPTIWRGAGITGRPWDSGISGECTLLTEISGNAAISICSS